MLKCAQQFRDGTMGLNSSKFDPPAHPWCITCDSLFGPVLTQVIPFDRLVKDGLISWLCYLGCWWHNVHWLLSSWMAQPQLLESFQSIGFFWISLSTVAYFPQPRPSQQKQSLTCPNTGPSTGEWNLSSKQCIDHEGLWLWSAWHLRSTVYGPAWAQLTVDWPKVGPDISKTSHV